MPRERPTLPYTPGLHHDGLVVLPRNKQTMRGTRGGGKAAAELKACYCCNSRSAWVLAVSHLSSRFMPSLQNRRSCVSVTTLQENGRIRNHERAQARLKAERELLRDLEQKLEVKQVCSLYRLSIFKSLFQAFGLVPHFKEGG